MSLYGESIRSTAWHSTNVYRDVIVVTVWDGTHWMRVYPGQPKFSSRLWSFLCLGFLLAFSAVCVYTPFGKAFLIFPAPSPVSGWHTVLCLCRILYLPCCWIGLFYCYCLLNWVFSPFDLQAVGRRKPSLLVTIVFTIPGTSLVQRCAL